jgi:hypothetical protein
MTRTFLRHYLEMVVAMLLGMAVVLGALAAAGVELASVELELLVMATSMTVPMVAWMRHRGHGWAPAAEMSGAMYAPTAAALVLLWTGLVEDEHGLMMIQHVAMFPLMFAAMLLRRDEYSHVTHA